MIISQILVAVVAEVVTVSVLVLANCLVRLKADVAVAVGLAVGTVYVLANEFLAANVTVAVGLAVLAIRVYTVVLCSYGSLTNVALAVFIGIGVLDFHLGLTTLKISVALAVVVSINVLYSYAGRLLTNVTFTVVVSIVFCLVGNRHTGLSTVVVTNSVMVSVLVNANGRILSRSAAHTGSKRSYRSKNHNESKQQANNSLFFQHYYIFK